MHRPPKSNKNVTLPPGFPAHLRQLRESRNLSKTDLAAAAGSTYRTVHDLEAGHRERAQEKTLMVLASALGVAYDKMVMRADNGVAAPPSSRRSRGLSVVLVTLFVVFAGTAWTTWNFAADRAEWTLEPKDLCVRDGIFGIELWRLHDEARIQFCKIAPWDSRILLVGMGSKAPSGGRVLALERATGTKIWEVEPDLDQLIRALGEEMVSAASMGCKDLKFLDVDGNGRQQILAVFIHGLYHPSAVCLVDQDGTLLRQYANKGHLYSALAADLDNDGKDEVVVAGVNNSPAYGGPTLILLDDRHWRGASIDSLCNPWSSEPDSSAIRFVAPCYPPEFQAMLEYGRLAATGLQAIPQADGGVILSVKVGCLAKSPMKLTVFFDDKLQVTNSVANDSFLEIMARDWPDSLKNGTGPGDSAWRADWLARATFFGAGR